MARFYDPYLNRWIQSDSIVPDQRNSQTWDRYSYVNNNPINFNDPSGHDVGCTSFDASRCKGKNNNLGVEFEKRKYDVSPVVRYIYNEIKANAKSESALIIKSAISIGRRDAGLLGWALKVAPRFEWDHKPKIQNNERLAGRDPEFQFAGTKKYKFDTWSNIHYGFIGKELGLTENELLDGAGAAQYLDDKFRKGRIPQPDKSVQGLRSFDQPQDRVTIQIGIDLWNTYGTDLLPEDIIWAIEHSVGIETEP